MFERVENSLSPSMIGRIKISMGLASKSWLILPRLKIEEKNSKFDTNDLVQEDQASIELETI